MKFYNERAYGSGVESRSLFFDGLVDGCVIAGCRQACSLTVADVGGPGRRQPAAAIKQCFALFCSEYYHLVCRF